MPAHRLTLEEMRDALFAAGADLDFQFGGKAKELWKAPYPRCRTVYGLIDREYLPPIFRAFDFANPDLHIPQRHETTVPQQALFFWNHPLIADRAQAVLDRADVAQQQTSADKIALIYRALYQRAPSNDEIAAGVEFVKAAEVMTEPAPVIEQSPWQYGFGEVDESVNGLRGFQSLPYFTGEAWQGGPNLPDAALGWVQLTATGGHPGNDRQHAIVRRWVAPRSGPIAIKSTLQHQVDAGDGIRAFIISSRQGILKSVEVHNRMLELNVEELEVEAGDSVDFVVDIRDVLNSDQFLWSPVITSSISNNDAEKTWDAERDFRGPIEAHVVLSPWQQYVQVLLSANEFVFVD
jgi:hypothetical protein